MGRRAIACAAHVCETLDWPGKLVKALFCSRSLAPLASRKRWMWRGEAGGSHCLREAGWRGRDKSIRFPPMPAAARDRITARRAPKNAEKAEPVLRGSVTRWCYGSSLRPTVARARRDDEEVGSRVRTCARSGTDIVRPGVGDRQGSMLAYALIGYEEHSALPTVALSVRGEDLSVARGATDRHRAVFACR